VEYTDKPGPSPAYLILLVVLVIVTGFCTLVLPAIVGDEVPLALWLLSCPVFLIMIELVHAAYATEYRIADGILYLRCGWIMRKRIPIEEIQSVEDARFIPRVLDWSPGQLGFCNRFTNGLLLETTKRCGIYVSPEDIDAFRRALHMSCRTPRRAGQGS